jgi:branched-subunit amino acid transport protein
MSQDLYIWIGIIGLMGATAISRTLLILWARDFQLPHRLQRALRFAPMAAIAAIIAPSVLLDAELGLVGLLDPKILGAVAGIVVGWLSKQMVACIGLGMLVYLAAKLML